MNNFYRKIYLKSERWRDLKRKNLSNECFCCGDRWQEYGLINEADKEWLELHHISYKNLGTTDEAKDLVTVCSLCHDNIHELVALNLAKLNNAHLIYKIHKDKIRDK